MNKLLSLILSLGLATAAAPRSAAAPPAAGQLLNVTGNVEIRRAGQPVRKGTLLFQLQPGDLLIVRGGGSAEVVLFKNGARFSLTEGAAARIEPLELQRRSGPAPKSLKRLSSVFLKRMNTPYKPASPRILGVLVRGSNDGSLGPRQPAPIGTVRASVVTLRWAGPIVGDQLRLRIRDGQHTVVRADLPPAAREYKLSPGTLQPGVDYVWSVSALTDGERGHQCRAPVRVLLPQERAELEAMEREVSEARRQGPDDPAPVLLMAQAYERLGLLDDARAAYQSVLRLRPADAGVRTALQRLAAN